MSDVVVVVHVRWFRVNEHGLIVVLFRFLCFVLFYIELVLLVAGPHSIRPTCHVSLQHVSPALKK